MNIAVFLELVEITSLSASILPLLLGSLYSSYYYGIINWQNLILIFIASILFHMAVNVNDNLKDFKNATNAHTFRNKTNVVGVNKLSLSLVTKINIILMSFSALIGIFLVFKTSIALLFMGIFCFLIGYFYAGGPHPINRTAFGEPLSGFTMGFMIFLISVYVNTANKIPLNWNFIWPIFIASGLTMFSISNLLLANTICDQQEDIQLGRKTLIYYIGKKAAINLVPILYIIGFLMLIVSALLGYLPKSILLTLITVPIIYKNTKFLYTNQIKKEAFPKFAKNLAILSIAQVISFIIGLLTGF
ncbi:1,4-dihydroxy-2-naphthoate polyprenyltransferase [Companilactobacillus sp. DQM5]|uniref:1,4-dihydroxy-2-naphthoate polyprenyltransferase n=1 Tax=Companilactobacillus sp. DQM5 TaxID=3463359 RepID=UPI004059EDC9